MRHLLILVLSILHLNSFAQTVGINVTTPQATLDVVGSPASTGVQDGIIPPRLTRAQLIAKTGYGANQAGAVVYVTDLSGTVNTATREIQYIGLYTFDGSKWNALQNKILGFSAYRSASFSINAVTQTTLIYPLEEFDTNNWYNTTTGVFQPTQPGYYYVTASSSVYNGLSFLRYISILKNGIISKSGSNHYTTGVSVSVSGLIYLNGTTDYINVSLYGNQAFTVTPAQQETYFQAHFVGN